MNSGIKARGALRIEIYENGRLVESQEDNNLVVNLGRENVAKLLGGATAGKSITKFQAGTSDTPPQLTDTAITNPFTKALSSVSYPSANQVQFNFLIDAHEANGKAIAEFGLLNSDDVLFARKTRTVINKVSPMVIVGAWIITVN